MLRQRMLQQTGAKSKGKNEFADWIPRDSPTHSAALSDAGVGQK